MAYHQEMEEKVNESESREQTIKKLEYFMERMTGAQLKLLAAFASGIFKKG